MSAGPARVAVVVPAHNEDALLPGCLRALHRAAHRAPAPVHIVVVADRCTDNTRAVAEIAAARTTIPHSVVEVNAANVGIARAAGADLALTRWGPDGLWLLTTDADSMVPAHWIGAHLAHARRGAELVVGTVEAAAWTGWAPQIAERYEHLYRRTVSATSHDHVHGANLGVDAATYLDLGGFPPWETGEDVGLVRRAQSRGRRVVFAVDVPVATSTRAQARAPRGFSAHLHGLAAEDGHPHPRTRVAEQA